VRTTTAWIGTAGLAWVAVSISTSAVMPGPHLRHVLVEHHLDLEVGLPSTTEVIERLAVLPISVTVP
jgi:hypothetical protein